MILLKIQLNFVTTQISKLSSLHLPLRLKTCCFKRASNNIILGQNPMLFICQASMFNKSPLFHVHNVVTFVSCDARVFNLTYIQQTKDCHFSEHLLYILYYSVCLNTSYMYIYCTVLLSFFLSLSPCLPLWLSEKVFPRTTHLLLIWKKIQLAAGHGRYVLEKKLLSLSTLIRCIHAAIELQLFLDCFLLTLACVYLFLFATTLDTMLFTFHALWHLLIVIVRSPYTMLTYMYCFVHSSV